MSALVLESRPGHLMRTRFVCDYHELCSETKIQNCESFSGNFAMCANPNVRDSRQEESDDYSRVGTLTAIRVHANRLVAARFHYQTGGNTLEIHELHSNCFSLGIFSTLAQRPTPPSIVDFGDDPLVSILRATFA